MKKTIVKYKLYRFLIVISIVPILLSLTACQALFGREGYFRDRGDDYVKASEIPPMNVPENLDSSSISELFVIPPISNEYVDTEAEFVTPKPDFAVSAENAQVKIQKLDTRRWIAVNSSPSEVWPRILAFLDESNINTGNINVNTGEIETVWLLLKGETENKDRYRIRLEQGMHANSSEIHVLQTTVAASTPGTGSINWPAQSSSAEREKWFVDKLAGYLAQEQSPTASLAAQSVGGARKVEFVQPYQQEPFLVFNLDLNRTWASVNGAVSRSPFATKDINISQGIIYITYDAAPLDENDKPGFFSRLFGFDKRAKEKHQMTLLHCQVLITQHDNKDVRVMIRNDKGEPLPQRDAEKLLSLIRNQLI